MTICLFRSLIFLTIIPGYLIGQINPQWDELIIGNLNIQDTLIINVVPIGNVFNNDKSYSPKAKYILDSSVFVFGGSNRIFRDTNNPESRLFRLNHAIFSPSQDADSNICYGKYKVEIKRIEYDSNGFIYLRNLDSLTIDYSDSDYPYGQLPWNNFTNDFVLYYFNEDSIYVQFHGIGNAPLLNLKTSDRCFEIWNQEGRGYFKNQNRGGFRNDTAYHIFGIDAREFGFVSHYNSNDLFVGLSIEENASTAESLLVNNNRLFVNSNGYVSVNNGKQLRISTPKSPEGSSTELVFLDSSTLVLYGGSSLIIEAPNKLTLSYGGNLTLHNGSEVVVYPGAKFCNEGGTVRGNGHITFLKGIHNTCEFDNFTASDSTSIVLDSATVSFPDNFTLHLKGKETALVVSPGSELLFGENSGIVCDSGARIIANNAIFASVDSTKKWNGISLNDPSHDTIRNCAIKNAMYGIALSGKYDPDESPEPYSIEISGCSFVNQTSYVLNNAIYLQNSAHVLLKGKTISSNKLSVGFTHDLFQSIKSNEAL